MAGRGGDGGGGRGYENLCPEFVGVRIVLYDLGGAEFTLSFQNKILFMHFDTTTRLMFIACISQG